MVPAELFAGRGISYVALGHLHRPQEIRPSDPTIGYSGSLLRYSLSEAGHAKSVTLVTLGAPGDDVVVERATFALSANRTGHAGSWHEPARAQDAY